MKNKKNLMIIVSIFFIGFSLTLHSFYYYVNARFQDICVINGVMNLHSIQEIISNDINKCHNSIYEIQEEIERKRNIEEEKNIVKNEFQSKLESIQNENRKQWFISYGSILEEYRNYPHVEIPMTVYEEYDIEELKLFQRLVAAETIRGNFESKCNVASVVWNRLYSEKYPNSIIDVIYQINGSVQFSPIYDGRIDTVEVTEDDVLAIEYTYMFGSTAYDCIAFDNVVGVSWNKDKLEVVFTDSINHTFYR